MRKATKVIYTGLAMALLALASGMELARAQTTPGGQVVAPGTRGNRSGATGCSSQETTPAAANANDANCTESAPGFASPVLDAPVTDTAHAVTALVRVDAAMPRPPVTLPDGNSFSVLGSVTLIKVRRADQSACLATGKRISARVNAATSTTCLDHKGELLALQECKSGSQDCTVMTAQEIALQQTAARP